MRDQKCTAAANCKVTDVGTDPDHMAPQNPIIVDGVFYAPATMSLIGSARTPEGALFGHVLLAHKDAGLMVAMPAPTLRDWADSLTIIADKIEAEAADAAKAQMDALQTRSGKGGAA